MGGLASAARSGDVLGQVTTKAESGLETGGDDARGSGLRSGKKTVKKRTAQWAWLVLVAGCGAGSLPYPVRPADVGTTSDVDVARSDGGNVADITRTDAPVMDVPRVDAPSLDAASGDVTVVDTAAVEDSAMDVPGVDTPIADAASTVDVTTVDTGSVSDSGVADTGTPVVCRSGTHLCGSSCASDISVTSCGSSCSACAVPTGGSATCSGGACGQSCPSGTTFCGGACIALNTTSNCGACGLACTVGQTCSAGTCVSSSGTCPTGMVLIPAGSFLMGDADTASHQAQPPHMVTLSAYCMDLTEVTVAAYRGCTSCTAPTAGTTVNYGNWGVMGRDNHPVNYVDWNQSRAYCQWRGGDLPTDAQWEYAARGRDVDNHIYPWGNAAPASQLCWYPTSPSGTCPVRTYPSGNSPFGIFDMACNVWEWTLDFSAIYTSAAAIDPTGPTSGSIRGCRGGSWLYNDATIVRAANRNFNSPMVRNGDLGFRCAHVVM